MRRARPRRVGPSPDRPGAAERVPWEAVRPRRPARPPHPSEDR
ncbi:hypothetical protein Y09_0093 [Brachybacterium sp. SW0106-09]|nr:hypothetical protein Y09_0093 [Brachybacterium sp. SW0106-09]